MWQDQELKPPRIVRWEPVRGGKPVRYVYVDEAGISANEPFTVVAGIIVHADSQYAYLEQSLSSLIATVPAHLRDGFVSHAKSIWGNPKLRDRWPLEQRKLFLRRMVGIPAELGVPIAIGICARGVMADPDERLSLTEWHHVQAFGRCIALADYFIRTFGAKNEIATVVSEDIPTGKRSLKAVVKVLQEKPLPVPHERTIASHGPPAGDFQVQRITRVRDTVHFAAKEESPLLQLADACAYSIRRFLEKREFGNELAVSMAGNDPRLLEALAELRDRTSLGSVLFYSSDSFDASELRWIET